MSCYRLFLDRLFFLLGSITLYVISMYVSFAWAERDRQKMIEISSLDGMLIASASILIIILTLLGWFTLLLGKRSIILISSGIALFLSIAIPLIIDIHLPLHFGYWTYLASYVFLIIGGLRIPKQNITP